MPTTNTDTTSTAPTIDAVFDEAPASPPPLPPLGRLVCKVGDVVSLGGPARRGERRDVQRTTRRAVPDLWLPG
ncbi:MAG: hypothetical protein LH480_01230 [Rubrivivax sp.]|nr:hypothetical protein [Rubrivivax sp.]